jgi:hypothetical protein
LALPPADRSGSARGRPPAPDPSDEVSAALSRFLATQEYPGPRPSIAILGRIAEQTKEAIEWFDYLEAELLHQADGDLRRHLQEAGASKSAASALCRLSPAELAGRLERPNAKYDAKRQKLDRNTAKSRSDLQRRHAAKQEKLAASWKDPNSLLRYSKPSPGLLEV